MGGSSARTGLPLAVSATADNANNQLTQWGTATLTYDANENMLSSGTDGYTWDACSQLVSTLSGASFQYDAFGRRTGKTILGMTTTYLYDGVTQVQELSGTTLTANLLTRIVDEYFTRTDASGTANFLTDALDNTLALADSTGTLRLDACNDSVAWGERANAGGDTGTPTELSLSAAEGIQMGTIGLS